MPSSQQIQTAVAAYFAAIEAMDPAAWADTFSEGGTAEDPVGSGVHQGREALMAHIGGICAVFARVKFDVESFISGDAAAVVWRADCTTKDARPVVIRGVDVFKIDDAGKVASVCGYWDPASMMSQIAA